MIISRCVLGRKGSEGRRKRSALWTTPGRPLWLIGPRVIYTQRCCEWFSTPSHFQIDGWGFAHAESWQRPSDGHGADCRRLPDKLQALVYDILPPQPLPYLMTPPKVSEKCPCGAGRDGELRGTVSSVVCNWRCMDNRKHDVSGSLRGPDRHSQHFLHANFKTTYSVKLSRLWQKRRRSAHVAGGGRR